MGELDERVEAGGGVVCVKGDLALRRRFDRAVARGELTRLLPATYAARDCADHTATRIAALFARFPNAVLVGRTAASATFWPPWINGPVEAVFPVRLAHPGFAFSRRLIPPDLVSCSGVVRCTAPALTALDLSVSTDGESIDRALRVGACTLADLAAALAGTPGRPGNRARRRALLDSRAQPWSVAERRLHVLLREAGIHGWFGNHRVVTRGQTYYLDVAFPAVKLYIEVDGVEFHSAPGVFETDRSRQNALTLAGWQVLRITWRMLQDDPAAVIALVRKVLRRAGRIGA